MKIQTKITNIGSSKGLIVPNYFIDLLELKFGDLVEIDLNKIKEAEVNK